MLRSPGLGLNQALLGQGEAAMLPEHDRHQRSGGAKKTPPDVVRRNLLGCRRSTYKAPTAAPRSPRGSGVTHLQRCRDRRPDPELFEASATDGLRCAGPQTTSSCLSIAC